tara:strand:+ start:74303 stop:75742 length:1440 start_codon:yes stop_codon:yes gene_type:complete
MFDRRAIPTLLLVLISFESLVISASGRLHAKEYDLVLQGGRVMDPESGFDGVRNVAIDDGVIAAISENPLDGKENIDATGLIVAPGFIDLHQHALDDASIRLKALDGVTSILELEVGTADVEQWYRQREGNSRIHHGVSIGHIPVRMKVMGDAPAFLPPEGARAISEKASAEQIEQMAERIEEGIAAGAVAVGFGLAYTPAATESEIVMMMRVAGAHGASCHIHMGGGSKEQRVLDAARMAATADAPVHIVHFQAGVRDQIGELLRLVEGLRKQGQDITIECYPWSAGMTEIQSAIFAPGFRERLEVDYSDIRWGATGEQLNEESFASYRKQGGLIIVKNNTDEAVATAVNHPLTMIASDGLVGHPRNAGTYARVLGHFVRDGKGLELMSALRKMSLMPAKRLEPLAPMFARKGRVQVGCDGDLTLFDPAQVNARATYEQPLLASKGISWVLVAGTPVVRDGNLVEDVYPGQGLRSDRK